MIDPQLISLSISKDSERVYLHANYRIGFSLTLNIQAYNHKQKK